MMLQENFAQKAFDDDVSLSSTLMLGKGYVHSVREVGSNMFVDIGLFNGKDGDKPKFLNVSLLVKKELSTLFGVDGFKDVAANKTIMLFGISGLDFFKNTEGYLNNRGILIEMTVNPKRDRKA